MIHSWEARVGTNCHLTSCQMKDYDNHEPSGRYDFIQVKGRLMEKEGNQRMWIKGEIE